MAYAVLHARKLGTLGGIHAHIHRLGGAVDRMGARADKAWTAENRLVMGTDKTAARGAEIIKSLPNQKKAVRKDAVKAIEMVFSASPEYFYDFKAAGITKSQWGTTSYSDKGYLDMVHKAKKTLDKQKLDKWVEDTTRWLKNEIGEDKIVSVVLHMDEKTPHIHAIVVPVVEGRLSCKKFFTPQSCTKWQVTYAQYTGLEKGQSAESKHNSQKEYEIKMAAQKAAKQAYKKAYQKGYEAGLNNAMSLSPVKWIKSAFAEWHKPSLEVINKIKNDVKQELSDMKTQIMDLTEKLQEALAANEKAKQSYSSLFKRWQSDKARAANAESQVKVLNEKVVELQGKLEFVEARARSAEHALANIVNPPKKENRQTQGITLSM
jgi:flagellar biosynthesis/type III secretory pathway protein FliH